LIQERSIVLVEDSEEDYAAFRRALKRSQSDIKVVRFGDGESFLEAMRAKTLPSPPTVIVLDLNLPALSGHEVLREIRNDAEMRGLPVVVLTTSANPQDVRTSYDLNVGGYIVKQGSFEGFRDRIESLAEYWFGTVKLP
jgi:DNA-binding NarL/FixJ family response regulator